VNDSTEVSQLLSKQIKM